VIPTGAEGIGQLQAAAAIARHIQREANNITVGLSIVTGLPLAAPAAVIPDDLQAARDAVNALDDDQRRRVLLFLAGYDTDAVSKAITWVHSRDSK
jgi:hypothetical protein